MSMLLKFLIGGSFEWSSFTAGLCLSSGILAPSPSDWEASSETWFVVWLQAEMAEPAMAGLKKLPLCAAWALFAWAFVEVWSLAAYWAWRSDVPNESLQATLYFIWAAWLSKFWKVGQFWFGMAFGCIDENATACWSTAYSWFNFAYII